MFLLHVILRVWKYFTYSLGADDPSLCGQTTEKKCTNLKMAPTPFALNGLMEWNGLTGFYCKQLFIFYSLKKRVLGSIRAHILDSVKAAIKIQTSSGNTYVVVNVLKGILVMMSNNGIVFFFA